MIVISKVWNGNVGYNRHLCVFARKYRDRRANLFEFRAPLDSPTLLTDLVKWLEGQRVQEATEWLLKRYPWVVHEATQLALEDKK